MRVDELIWNSFAKKKLKGNETVKHINGKEEDCHILNLQVERKKSGKNAKIKIIRTNSNDKEDIVTYEDAGKAAVANNTEISKIRNNCSAVNPVPIDGYIFRKEEIKEKA